APPPAARAAPPASSRPFPRPDPSPRSPSSVTSLCRGLACKVAAPSVVPGRVIGQKRIDQNLGLARLDAKCGMAVRCLFHGNCLLGNVSPYWKCKLSPQLPTRTSKSLIDPPPVKVMLGKSRKDFQSHRRKISAPSLIVNSQRSSGICGVGPADRTGKSVVRYCPGGSFLFAVVRRPINPRAMVPMHILSSLDLCNPLPACAVDEEMPHLPVTSTSARPGSCTAKLKRSSAITIST